MQNLFDLALTVNGTHYKHAVDPRTLLSDFLRHDLGLTGTHVGCEHGVCGACTVLLDGSPVRSCLMFAVQTHGHEVTTIEGLGTMDHLSPNSGSLPRGSRCAMWILYAGHLDHGQVIPGAECQP